MAENTTNLTNLVVTDLTVGGDLSIADDLVIVDDFTLGLASTIIIGTQANTAGSGHPLTASDARTICAFNDDGGANIGDSVRGIQSRMLLTVDQSGGTIRALQGQLKLANLADVTTGIYTAVQGYVEMAGTHVCKTGATFSCFDASTEITTSLTVDSGGEYFGVHVETTGAGTITNNGTCAAIGITKASGAATWPYGIFFGAGAVTGAIGSSDGLSILTTVDNQTITVGSGTLGYNLTWYGGDASTTVTFDCDGGSNTTGLWTFGADDHGVDVRFDGATASAHALWDESANELYFDGADLWLKDDDQLEFGDSSDVVATWAAGGGLNVTVAADNTVVTVGTGTLSADLKWFGGDTSTYVYFNADGGSGSTGEWAFGVDDHGVDVKFYGATASQYLLWDESANQLLTSGTAVTMVMGAQANTAGSGTRVTGTNGGTLRVFSDDGGASIADSVRGIQSRMLLTATQAAGTIRALQGQLKVVDTFGVGTGIYTAVQGYVELAGTHAIGSGATASCFDASTEIGTVLTVDSGAEYFGIHVETTGAGTITNNGTCAAIGITKASGAASWPIGLYIDSDCCTAGIRVAKSGSNTTNGLTLGSATALNGFYADDGGADQTTSTVWRNLEARTYYSVDQTLAAADAYVIRGQLKAASGVDFGGDTSVKAATNSYVELAGATTVGAGSFLAGHFAEIWIDGNLTATGKVAGVMSRCYSSGASTFGNYAAAFMATKQWASTDSWPVALYIDAADYALYAPTGTAYECGFKIGSMTSVGGADGNTADGLIRVMVGSTAYYIALYAAGSLSGE